MKVYALCPCCSSKLIHQISHHRDYWFCRSCWQEMPAIHSTAIKNVDNFEYQKEKVTAPLSSLVKPRKVKLGIT